MDDIEGAEAPAVEETHDDSVQTPAAPSSDAPWAQELASQFADDTIRSQVDEFLRGNIQPYVTRLEQESVGNRDANRLWQDFAENPYETYVGVTKELFGDDLALRIASALESDDDPTTDHEEHEVPDYDLAIDEDELPESVREAVDFYQQQQQASAWEQEMNRVIEDYPDVEIDADLLNPFVIAAEGDFDVAVASYAQFVNNAREKFGLSVGDLSDVNVPPVIDSDATGTSTPPQQKQYESLDDAMDDFFAEQNAPPPVVGSS